LKPDRVEAVLGGSTSTPAWSRRAHAAWLARLASWRRRRRLEARYRSKLAGWEPRTAHTGGDRRRWSRATHRRRRGRNRRRAQDYSPVRQSPDPGPAI